MCFSANASFSAGVVLTVIGVATIKKVQHPSQIMFASIPLIFAVQQITEGVLWLALPKTSYPATQVSFTYIFLFFALVVWPLWVPLAILLLEKESIRKRVQRYLVAAGFLVGLYFAWCLLKFPVQSNIVGYHVAYTLNFPPAFRNYSLVLYGLATIIAPFFSPIKRMWMLGVTIAVSFIITAIFYEQYILSVWCFFASVISISVYLIMREINNDYAADTSLFAASMNICRP